MKRLFDIIFSIILLFFFAPLIILSIFMIMVFDLQNPFFIQERSGLNGKSIMMIKLQTMKTIQGTKQITLLGKFLRISKIDELPQLISVIKNDMSLIGPRPLYIEFNNYYKKKHILRTTIKPGLSGLAQVKVRDSTNWQKKFNFDVIYVKKVNFKIELYIILNTILIIAKSIFLNKERAIETIDYKKNFYKNYK